MVTDTTPAAVQARLTQGEPRLIGVHLSLADRDCANQVLPYCAERGVEVLARTSLPHQLPPRLDDALRAVMLRHGNARRTVGLAWALAWTPVLAVATRVSRPAELEETLNAAQLKLTGRDLDDIAHALELTGYGTGPTRPAVHA